MDENSDWLCTQAIVGIDDRAGEDNENVKNVSICKTQKTNNNSLNWTKTTA